MRPLPRVAHMPSRRGADQRHRLQVEIERAVPGRLRAYPGTPRRHRSRRCSPRCRARRARRCCARPLLRAPPGAVRSCTITCALPHARATSAAAASSMSTSASAQPRAARASAVARPSPPPAPVIMAKSLHHCRDAFGQHRIASSPLRPALRRRSAIRTGLCVCGTGTRHVMSVSEEQPRDRALLRSRLRGRLRLAELLPAGADAGATPTADRGIGTR